MQLKFTFFNNEEFIVYMTNFIHSLIICNIIIIL